MLASRSAATGRQQLVNSKKNFLKVQIHFDSATIFYYCNPNKPAQVVGFVVAHVVIETSVELGKWVTKKL